MTTGNTNPSSRVLIYISDRDYRNTTSQQPSLPTKTTNMAPLTCIHCSLPLGGPEGMRADYAWAACHKCDSGRIHIPCTTCGGRGDFDRTATSSTECPMCYGTLDYCDGCQNQRRRTVRRPDVQCEGCTVNGEFCYHRW